MLWLVLQFVCCRSMADPTVTTLQPLVVATKTNSSLCPRPIGLQFSNFLYFASFRTQTKIASFVDNPPDGHL